MRWLLVAAIAAPLFGCIPRDEEPLTPRHEGHAFALVDKPASVGGWNAAVYATSRVGTPYCWGGAGPSCFDCSGLTHAAWLYAGKAIPRTSSEQAANLPEIPMASAAPGDVLWRPGHVGIYVGSGLVVAAIGRGDIVRYQPATSFVRAFRP